MTYRKKLPNLEHIQKFALGGDTFWAVPSASDPSVVYEVRKPDTKYTCNCMDYKARHMGQMTECKHGTAVRELEELTAIVIVP